ncbi:MAG: PHP domain-containing protein [Candidatus Sumerlaeia bacterium]|nr:PHP domain-containing protein [Candidatus Sumerlaeia bacterium]
MRRRRKFYFDLQVHTRRFSPCSCIPPEEVVAAARVQGLDGVALTEHFGGWTAEDLKALKETAGGGDFVILSGYEIRTHTEDRATGDLLVFGVAERPSEPCSIDALCREVHKQGGVVIAPHPFAGLQGIGDEVYSARIDGLEVYNARYGSRSQFRRALEAWHQLGIAGVACSDAHAPEEIGRFCTEFDDCIASERDLVEAIKAQRCRPRPRPAPHPFWRWLWLR